MLLLGACLADRQLCVHTRRPADKAGEAKRRLASAPLPCDWSACGHVFVRSPNPNCDCPSARSQPDVTLMDAWDQPPSHSASRLYENAPGSDQACGLHSYPVATTDLLNNQRRLPSVDRVSLDQSGGLSHSSACARPTFAIINIAWRAKVPPAPCSDELRAGPVPGQNCRVRPPLFRRGRGMIGFPPGHGDRDSFSRPVADPSKRQPTRGRETISSPRRALLHSGPTGNWVGAEDRAHTLLRPPFNTPATAGRCLRTRAP